MLSPIVPHITQHLWSRNGTPKLIIDEVWPAASDEKLKEAKKEIIVQINGKLRGKVNTKTGTSESEIKSYRG